MKKAIALLAIFVGILYIGTKLIRHFDREQMLDYHFYFLENALEGDQYEELKSKNNKDSIILYTVKNTSKEFQDLIESPPKKAVDFYNSKGITNLNYRGLVIMFAFHKRLNGERTNLEKMHAEVKDFYPGYMERNNPDINKKGYRCGLSNFSSRTTRAKLESNRRKTISRQTKANQ